MPLPASHCTGCFSLTLFLASGSLMRKVPSANALQVRGPAVVAWQPVPAASVWNEPVDSLKVIAFSSDRQLH